MIPQQSYWGAVVVDDYIKDANGKTWKIVHASDSEITGDRAVRIRDRDGVEGLLRRPPDDRPVTKLVPSSDEKAVDLVRHQLGGQISAVRVGDGPWLCPPAEMADIEWARRHLLDLHHVDASSLTTIEEILAYHRSSPAAVPHEHDHNGALRP